MILWINGSFGSGKTQTAHELHRRLPDSYVFDPEHAGYYIRKNLPKEAMLQNDFQNYPMWREINYTMLAYIHREYQGTVIVPMTVVNPVYFEEIVGTLRNDGVVVHHFALCASKETILKRLRSRGEGPQSWAAQQIDRCLDGLSSEVFRHHLDTENLSVEDNAAAIASLAGVQLQPDTRGRMRKAYDRVKTQLRHIRF
ncbi:tunicamycin resistance protein [Paenibacillus sp. H1-7]|uniref:AAA family ATPase n=1 Tax=Paenibacillus sp. H1-7 TaxID=2282849 RepID=UPI001EF796F0|nr:AAA family ATPase [Paenibacillus sp. H1-7]ULL19610.1 tunicamycin resistance protein [Paenibacillus sp. H1-7]